MRDSPSSTGPRRSTMRAVLAVGMGRAEAIGWFSATRDGFIRSLVPLIVVPFLNGLISGRIPSVTRLITDLLTSIAALLVPPVVTHMLAERWGRGGAWLRFAVAFNWCQFGLLMVAVTGLFAVTALGAGDMIIMIVGVIGIYALWLHWFVARHGLGITSGRAVLLVLAVHAATTLVVLVPRVIAAIMRTQPAVPS